MTPARPATTAPPARGTRPRASSYPTRGATLPYLLFRTTPRDRWLLAMLGEHRTLTAEQITALAFNTLRSANRRLATLTALHLTDRFRTGPYGYGAQPYHYILGPAGALITAAAHDLTPKQFGYDRAKLLRQAVRPDLAHTTGCNRLLVGLAAHHRNQPERTLTAWWNELSCIPVWGDVIRPDAYAVYTAPDSYGTPRECGFFFEYDTGTESLTQLAAKLDGYRRHRDAYGAHRPVLIHLPGLGREHALHARLTATGPCPVPVATATATDLAGPVWRPVGDGERHLPLPDLPGYFAAAGYRLLDPVHHDSAVRAPAPIPDPAWPDSESTRGK